MGRPSRLRQEQRHEELLAIAIDVFLDKGFEKATMEEFAMRVGMSKRTLYAHYKDKSALFLAAVNRATKLYTIPRAQLEAVASDDLEETLTKIGHLRLANMARPIVTKLQRILNTESYRFPELFNAALHEGAGPTIDFLCEVFEHHQARGEISAPEPRRAAIAFLDLAVGGPGRVIVSGNRIDPQEIETRVRFAVKLFLNGVRVQ